MRERIEAAFTGVSIDRDVLDELAQHAESTYEALRADGATAAEASARIDALIAGWRRDPSALNRVVKRLPAVVPPPATPEAWPGLIVGAMADLIYGLRMLRARPGAGAVTILTIALGVGAVTTLFSVAYGVLLRPLPWGDTERLIRLSETRGGREARVPGTIMNGSYLAWADSPQTIESIGAFSEPTMTLTGAGDAARISVARVTPSMLELLRVRPLRGRLFDAGEGRLNQAGVALISAGLWEQRYGAREDAIGQLIVLDGQPYTIAGVLPRDFRFPSGETRAWIAWEVPAVDAPNGAKVGTISRGIARLKPGVTLAQAAAEGTARANAGADAGLVAMSLFGARGPIQIFARDAKEAASADVRPAIIILLIASILLFVTAIANVANMQLARATARHREMTIRAALGAGTRRIARQLLIENALTGAIGGALGLLVTAGLHAALPAVLPADFPRADAIAIDGRVLLVTLVLSLITTVACGVLPLLHVRRLEIARALSESSLASAGAGRSRVASMRALIVASQVAVTCVLVIGAAILARSFAAHLRADRGYDSRNLLTAQIPFPSAAKPEQSLATLERILDRVAARPGVMHAGISSGLPLVSSGGFMSFNFPSPLRGGEIIEVETIRRIVSPGYFGALGIRVRAGRALTAADDASAAPVAVVNRSFVKKYFDVPIEQAVGLSLGTAVVRGPKGSVARETTIVGVVDDMKQDAPDGAPQPEIFLAHAQAFGRGVSGSSSNISQAFVVVRTEDDPVTHVETLRTALREEDPALPIDTVMTMDERIGRSVARPRTYAVLLGGFAVFALIIAGAGLFGVLSYSVTQRSRELAVRTALGAPRGAVIGVALRHVTVAMIAGLVIGLAAAAALSNQLSPFIYGVSTRDWLSFGVAPVTLLLMGIAACVVPARRVAKTDPVQVLREI